MFQVKMILCGFRDNFPAQENGHYTIPEKRKYSQMLRLLYQATKMSPIILDLGFMDADLENNRVRTKWCALLEIGTTVQQFMFGTASALKLLDDKEIPASYTTLVYALKPNRPELVSSIELFNKSYSKSRQINKYFITHYKIKRFHYESLLL